MDYVHACSFCGWTRAAETPVVLPAGCPDCGCPADSSPRDEHERATVVEPARTAAPPLVLRAVVVLFALAFAFASARFGYDEAGVEGAIIALGVTGFLLLPFVPERVGDARPRRAG